MNPLLLAGLVWWFFFREQKSAAGESPFKGPVKQPAPDDPVYAPVKDQFEVWSYRDR